MLANKTQKFSQNLDDLDLYFFDAIFLLKIFENYVLKESLNVQFANVLIDFSLSFFRNRLENQKQHKKIERSSYARKKSKQSQKFKKNRSNSFESFFDNSLLNNNYNNNNNYHNNSSSSSNNNKSEDDDDNNFSITNYYFSKKLNSAIMNNDDTKNFFLSFKPYASNCKKCNKFTIFRFFFFI
jgi:hypothetical protein